MMKCENKIPKYRLNSTKQKLLKEIETRGYKGYYPRVVDFEPCIVKIFEECSFLEIYGGNRKCELIFAFWSFDKITDSAINLFSVKMDGEMLLAEQIEQAIDFIVELETDLIGALDSYKNKSWNLR